MHIPTSKRAEDALDELQAASPLWALLDELDARNEVVSTKLGELGASTHSGKINELAGELRALMLSVTAITSKVNVRELFRNIETLHGRLVSLFEDVPGFPRIAEMLNSLDIFAEVFNKFVASPSGDGAALLLKHARVTNATYRTFHVVLQFLKAEADDVSPVSGESEFSLMLDHTRDLDDFAERLRAISRIYSELSQLLGVRTPPLRVAKIESGSLFTKLVGDTKVVGLLVDLLRDSAGFLHRRFTNEGKIGAISGKVDAFDKVVHLTERLEAAGVDVAATKDQLSKGAHALAADLTRLLSDQPAVSVNGETLSVGDHAAAALLEHARVPLLNAPGAANAERPAGATGRLPPPAE